MYIIQIISIERLLEGVESSKNQKARDRANPFNDGASILLSLSYICLKRPEISIVLVKSILIT